MSRFGSMAPLKPAPLSFSLLAPTLVAISILLAGCGRADSPAATAGVTDATARKADAACDLNHGACQGNSSWGPYTIAVSPRPIPVLTPVSVELRFRNPGAAEATVDLAGAEMEMGPNRVKMQRIDAHTRQAQFVIPVCLTGSMRWRLTVTLHENGRSESMTYEFTTPTGHAGKPAGQP